MLRRITSLHEVSQHEPLETQLDLLKTRLKIGFGHKLGLDSVGTFGIGLGWTWTWARIGRDRAFFGLRSARIDLKFRVRLDWDGRG